MLNLLRFIIKINHPCQGRQMYRYLPWFFSGFGLPPALRKNGPTVLFFEFFDHFPWPQSHPTPNNDGSKSRSRGQKSDLSVLPSLITAVLVRLLQEAASVSRTVGKFEARSKGDGSTQRNGKTNTSLYMVENNNILYIYMYIFLTMYMYIIYFK